MKSSLQKRRKFLILFFWIGFLLVSTLNIFVWLYLDQVERTFQVELEKKLSAVGKLITRLVDEVELGSIIPGEKTSIEYLYYSQLFEDVIKENNLQNIICISPAKEVLIAVPEISTAINDSYLYDNKNFEQALNGKLSASGIQEYSGEHFMTVFAPVLNIDGFVSAVILLEAPANYFLVLSTLRNRILLFSIINFILLAAFAYALYKIIRRTIEFQTQIKDEEHLVQLGTMAANVAHELRNPLNIIEGTNDIIRKKYSDQEDEIFSFIPDEVKRLSNLIDNFLHFARLPVLNPEKKDAKDLISRLKMSISDQDVNRVHFQIPETSFSFVTDFNLLEQALLNLIVNAIQATNHKGNVNISIEPGKHKHLVCKVEDNGKGIEPELQGKIFEPFFTTKEKGTGLGLAITKRLIEHLGGELALKSVSGERTLFTLTLPGLKQ